MKRGRYNHVGVDLENADDRSLRGDNINMFLSPTSDDMDNTEHPSSHSVHTRTIPPQISAVGSVSFLLPTLRQRDHEGSCRSVGQHPEPFDVSPASTATIGLEAEQEHDERDLSQHPRTTAPVTEKCSTQKGSNASPSTKETPAPRSVLEVWWLELTSTLLALSCLMAVVAILKIYQNKPLPDWPEMLSINSVISIFSAFFKAALIMPIAEGIGQLKWTWFSKSRRLSDVSMFDEASRGPWGSLCFLIKQIPYINESFVASLGAFITIAALAIDPFTQSLVEHTVCRRPLGFQQAQISRSNVYSTYNTDHQYRGRTAQSHLDSSMQVALYLGLIDPHNTSSLLNFNCATGNCTFGSEDGGAFFSSLAMCHSCSDISHTLSGNGSIALPWSLSSSDNVLGSTVALSSVPRSGTPMFFQFEAIMRNLTVEDTVEKRNKPFAVQCSLQPCVKTYSAVVNNSKYSEFEKDKGRAAWLQQDSYSPAIPIAFSHVANSTLIDGKWEDCKPSRTANSSSTIKIPVDPKTKLLGYSYLQKVPEWVYYPRECVWWVDLTSYFAMSNALDRLLRNNVSLDFGGGGFENVNGDAWMLKLYAKGRGNLTVANDLMEGLAAAMTAAMRNRPFDDVARQWDKNGDLSVANGTSYEVTTCVEVHWPWIVYPAVMLVLQLVFCSLMVLASRRTGQDEPRVLVDWKSSPLAFLFHGLDGHLHRKLVHIDSVKEMDEVAKTTNVQLCQVHDGDRPNWRFCEG
ncbi:hypothetical protein BGZ63DRAFT_392189 [Mariannaea sp. PMI_226]|nr:hypothetical protein BGZ63DRAFT_392189 [Mariannaea sp. PMI_226]